MLALVGAGALIASFAVHGHPIVGGVSVNVPVNPGARDPGDIAANNSPSLARDPVEPAVLAVANRVDTPLYSCALDVSRDGGRTWSAVRVPIAPGEQRKCYAPDVTFARDGTLYMSYLTLRGAGNVPHAAWLVHSTHGGRTLSAPRRVLGPLAFQTRLTADPARPRRLYLTWLQASGTGLYRYTTPGNPIEVMRSDDGGAHWSAPVRVSSPARLRVVSPVPVVGPHGVLYVLYLDLGGDVLDYEGASGGFGGPPYGGHFSLLLGRSSDGGATWSESVVDRSIVPTRRFIIFLAPFPSLAVDRHSGRIYAGFEDGRLGDPDVYVSSLASGAASWSRPVRVNDTPRHDGTAQYLPALAVAPNGRLDVIYYDRRADARNRLSTVSLQSSFDEGRTFSPRVTLSDRAFNSRIGAGSELGLPDLGSNVAVDSTAAQALAVWTDTRAGTVLSNKQDITFARARFSSAGGLGEAVRDLLRYGGAVAVLLGVAAALSAAARLRR
ncbi:MAG TPA: sialidase family protein [Solirubrobacteraceae bacterium]|nr:sialidase family protein [Solirubrobacteraceae bacterium]